MLTGVARSHIGSSTPWGGPAARLTYCFFGRV